VGDGIRPRLAGDFHQALGDQRPGDRGAEQVLALVQRIGAEHREHEVAREFLGQVVHVDGAGAHRLGLAAGGLKFGVALADIRCEGDHLAVIGLL
jgi:hypothetical protein